MRPRGAEGEADALAKEDYVALAGFRRALRRFLAFSEAGARAAGLTGKQHELLLAVKGEPDRDWATVGELAVALGVRPNTAVGLVNRSVRSGFLARRPEPADRRVVRVVVTAKGEAALARLALRNRKELDALRQALRLPFLDLPERRAKRG